MASIYTSLKTITNKKNSFNSPKLRSLSGKGFNFEDSVIYNSEAIGVNEGSSNNFPYNPYTNSNDDILTFAQSDIYSSKNIPLFDQSYAQRREALRSYANQDEIEQILDILADEILVYNPNKYFAQIKWDADLDIKQNVQDTITETLEKNFKKIYRLQGFRNENSAWHLVKEFLISGYLCKEIIWSNDNKSIQGFKQLDPITVTPKMKDDGTRYWVQFDNDPKNRRELLDAQIIFISYSSLNDGGRSSYTERLIRSFNLLRIMEQSRIIWAVVNSSYKTKFIIPVGGKSKTVAKQTVSKLMNAYRENIQFDTNSGELQVNGKAMMPFNKEYWIPEGDNGTTQIETFGNDGPDLSDTDSLEYFKDKLISVSKVPKNRFIKDDSPSWASDAEDYTREEIYFERFLSRLRNMIEELLIKPVILQTKIDVEELEDDEMFDETVYIDWVKYDVFEEIKEMEMFKKRIEVIETAKDSLIDEDSEGNEIKFFSNKMLIEKYLKWTDDDFKLNNKYKKEELDALNVDNDL